MKYIFGFHGSSMEPFGSMVLSYSNSCIIIEMIFNLCVRGRENSHFHGAEQGFANYGPWNLPGKWSIPI